MANDFVQRTTSAAPGAMEHLLPRNATLDEVELSIVIPAMNEEITVGEFMEWSKEGLQRAGVSGQILIVDSSTDNTPAIVLEHGGEVLRVPKRGVGSAYLDSLPYIRGKWILMGDADLTYDFREIAPFVAEFRKGAEFIMGSRFRGSIEKGAMPKLHRYFGTPLTNWILNRIYRSNFSDIHCGIRGVTREALDRINITSRGWEYASEMVLKAARLKLISSEVPIKFYKDREGRLSHHLRVGWRSPWLAGWVNLKVMLVYAADSFLLKAGAVLLVIGLVLSLGLAAGPVRIGRIGFSLYWMLLGVTCATLGYSSIQIGILARVMHGLRPRFIERIKRVLTSSWDDRIGQLYVGRSDSPWASRLPVFETRAEPASYLASSHFRSAARHPWIPDILLHAADGNGKPRHLKVSPVSPRAHESYGQHGLTLADRLGVWLSQRAIRRHLPIRSDLEVLELGCGYGATQLLALEPRLKRGIGVDFQIAPELRESREIHFLSGNDRGDHSETGKRKPGSGDAYLSLGAPR